MCGRYLRGDGIYRIIGCRFDRDSSDITCDGGGYRFF